MSKQYIGASAEGSARNKTSAGVIVIRRPNNYPRGRAEVQKKSIF